MNDRDERRHPRVWNRSDDDGWPPRCQDIKACLMSPGGNGRCVVQVSLGPPRNGPAILVLVFDRTDAGRKWAQAPRGSSDGDSLDWVVGDAMRLRSRTTAFDRLYHQLWHRNVTRPKRP